MPSHAVGCSPVPRLELDLMRRYFIASRVCVSRYLFASMASTAESLRSVCGSERTAPECCKQLFPGTAPHVGQGTEENCSSVMSFILTGTACDQTFGVAAQFRTLSLGVETIGTRRLDAR